LALVKVPIEEHKKFQSGEVGDLALGDLDDVSVLREAVEHPYTGSLELRDGDTLAGAVKQANLMAKEESQAADWISN
jgi:hypothetical protein